MKKEITIHCVYHVQADKLITFDSFEEMLLTLMFIKSEPT